jgi:hypothetical protein
MVVHAQNDPWLGVSDGASSYHGIDDLERPDVHIAAGDVRVREKREFDSPLLR